MLSFASAGKDCHEAIDKATRRQQETNEVEGGYVSNTQLTAFVFGCGMPVPGPRVGATLTVKSEELM